MYYVYILHSNKLDKKYLGMTSDIKRRIREHNFSPKGFTKSGRPWQIIYYEGFINKQDALREEKFLKTGKGRERRKYLLKSFFESRRGGRVA
jgi:putative endonuclease